PPPASSTSLSTAARCGPTASPPANDRAARCAANSCRPRGRAGGRPDFPGRREYIGKNPISRPSGGNPRCQVIDLGRTAGKFPKPSNRDLIQPSRELIRLNREAPGIGQSTMRAGRLEVTNQNLGRDPLEIVQT